MKMYREHGRSLIVIFLAVFLSLTGVIIQIPQPVQAESNDYSFSIYPNFTAPGVSPTYTFHLAIPAGSKIPAGLKIEVPSVYSAPDLTVGASETLIGSISIKAGAQTLTANLKNNHQITFTMPGTNEEVTYNYTVNWDGRYLELQSILPLIQTATAGIDITVYINSGLLQTSADEAKQGVYTWNVYGEIPDQGEVLIATIPTQVYKPNSPPASGGQPENPPSNGDGGITNPGTNPPNDNGGQTIVSRLSGADRFATAVAIAEKGWSSGSDNVVLVNAYSFPDALAATPLAYKLNAPILLTEKDHLTLATLNELVKLKVKRVYLVGGTGALAQSIEDALATMVGNGNIFRYAGTDRYETAWQVAQALGMKDKIVIASGEDEHFSDALSISSYAAHEGIPILFVERDNIPEATALALASGQVKESLVAGGEGAVSPEVYRKLPGPVRFWGSDRYATATAIAQGLALNPQNVYIVTGLDFPDALVAGNLAAHACAPLLMVDHGIPGVTADYLKKYKEKLSNLTLIGGSGVITQSQESTLGDFVQKN